MSTATVEVLQKLSAANGLLPAPATGRTTVLFQWPAPPLFTVAADAAAPGRDATVELAGGGRLTGEVVSIDADGNALHLRMASHEGLRALPLEGIRKIRLQARQAFVPDRAALGRLGASTREAADKPFAVMLRDGTGLAGHTRGFINGSHGLFLFLVEQDARFTVTCFVPKHQLRDVHMGAQLGEALPALAHGGPQRERGDYLAERAIASADDLARALREQKHRPNVRLGDLLIEIGLITPDDLQKALATQRGNRQRRLGDILIAMGVVSSRDIQVALSDKLGIPTVNVREFVIEPAALKLVSSTLAIRHQVLPLLRLDQGLVVAVDNPMTMDCEQELRFAAGCPIVPVIGSADDIRTRLNKEYLAGPGASPAPAPSHNGRARQDARIKVEELANQLAIEAKRNALAAPEIEARVSDSTLVRLINKVISDAHALGASDIHIETDPSRNTRIRFRKDGDLEDYLELTPAFRNAVVSRLKVMAGLDISERRRAQDGKINFGRFGALDLELRVAVIPTSEDQEDVVMRLAGTMTPQPLTQLGFSPRDLTELRALAKRSYGLFLVCGPTGSGKTTTLHSVLNHINTPDLKIWTAEDPIEITQPGLRQVQVNAKIDWTFAAAMRAFLRADPDVIMVGEMRDGETTKIGIEASLTGHLVLSTLHTNSAAESVTRLLNLGMDPFNFSDALLGVLSQRLARRLCPHCKTAHAAGDAELLELAHEYCAGTDLAPAAVIAEWRAEFGSQGQLKLHTARGCEHCNGGYKGRLGIYELLVASPQVKQLISARATVPELVAAGQASGMRLLRQDALRKALAGELDVASARAVAG